MAVTLTINGVDFNFPQAGESPGWGSAVQSWASAVTSGLLQKAGGAFTLTADVDFGATYGLRSTYYKSRAAAVSSVGVVRLGNAEYVSWRDAGNSADLGLRVNASDVLEYNGNPILTLALGTAENVLKMNAGGTAFEWSLLADANIDASAAIAYSKLALTGTIVDADVSASAAIAYSKLAALTADRVLVSSGAGAVSVSSVTSTTLGFLDATSSVQTQLDAKAATAGATFTGNVILDNAQAVRFSETDANGSHFIGIKAPDSVTADVTLILPDGAGTNGYALTTDGTSQLAWSAVATVSNNLTRAESASYTITDIDNARTVLVTTAGTGRTITLPTAADNDYRIITIKKVDSGVGSVTVDGEGAETIDGSATLVLRNQYEFITVQSDGTNWVILSGTPTAMTDQLATSLGKKVYQHGTTYAGGNAPTVSLFTGGGSLSSVDKSYFYPYQTQDGTWRLRFNVAVTASSTSRTSFELAIVGVTFTAGGNYAIAGNATIGPFNNIRAAGGTSRIGGTHGTITSTSYSFSGDVPLSDKPTWAY